jgi:hypothetical protein
MADLQGQRQEGGVQGAARVVRLFFWDDELYLILGNPLINK